MSHETIYRSLFVQARGVLKKELLGHLRSKRSMRRSRPVDPNGDRRGHMKDAVSIRQRPAAVEDRAVPGHWEGDLLSGPNNTYIATLVERHTRYVMLAKVAGKDTQLISSRRISLPRNGCRVDLRIVLFEDCSAFTRVAACTLALSPIRDTLIEGFSHFVTSMTAPIASGWSGCRVGLAPTGKRRLCTAHTRLGHCSGQGRFPC